MTCLFCLISPLLFSQSIFTDTQKRAYNLILELKLNDAQQHLGKSPADCFLLHLVQTIDFLITESPTVYEQLEAQNDVFTDVIENSPDGPEQKFFLAEIKLRNAFTNLKLGNELSATWQLRQSYKLIQENIEKYPDFIPNYKTMGILHVLIGSVPEQYQWIINLLGMQGDIKQGLLELGKVSSSQDIFTHEARLLEATIYAYLLNKADKASQAVRSLPLDENQDLVAYIAMAIYLKNGNAKNAFDIYKMYKNNDRNPLLHYQAGEMFLQLGQYRDAENALEKFVALFKGQNFIKDAYYKLFLAYWLQNQNEKALLYLNKARNQGQTLSEADKHANKMLDRSEKLNRDIMKIRFFTDGGNFHEADSIINVTDTSTLNADDKLEFQYRAARLSHKQGDIAKAIALYKQVIKQQQGSYYFAPNSCLQLGYIYKDMGEVNKAESWLQKALKYKGHEYKNSIDNEAKAALKSL